MPRASPWRVVLPAALLGDAALWTALALFLHAPTPADDATVPEEVALERLEVTTVTAPLAILDAPDLSDRAPESPRARAQHDHDPPRPMRRRQEPSGAIVRDHSPRRGGLPSRAPPVVAASDDPEAPPAVPSPEPGPGPAANALPLITGSDDVPAEFLPGPRTDVPTLAAPLAAYLDEIRRAVRAQWRPSEIYRRLDPDGKVVRAVEGMTVLLVRVRADGSIAQLSLDEPSGLLPLDREAMEAFRRAQPFLPPPAGLAGPDGVLAFRFGLYLDLSLERFLSLTARRLRNTWTPPRVPRSRPFREVAVALVHLRADGALSDASIELSNGQAAGDSALEAIYAVGLFPPPPPALRVAAGLSQFRIAFIARAYGDHELRLFRHAPDARVLLPAPQGR